MTIAQLQAEGAAALTAGDGLPNPRREARWLLARALGQTEAWLLAHAEEPVAAATEALFRTWLSRRAAGEPAHYIVGSCPFWGRLFAVTPAVLIPRPETELIVECALTVPEPERPRILDVGTGSGCLAVTLALELPGASVAATDVSPEAVAVAAANARALGASVRFTAGDLAAHVRGEFDLVVANLPYVPADEIPGLAVEIRAHEPHVALAGGEDGADLLRTFMADLPRLLAPGGHAMLEMGPRQRAGLRAAVAASGLVEIHRGLDHAGIERVLVLRKA
ncbi:MAG: peptide chain release factor N(5)-glutamine methyltransferase [Thermoanaerobaculaceae bacterium]|nr:peptide chain release factor N(5)-glutamine methyltransferase [Thermoanaerobaculaceae bacterium]TAM54909.1 MAG: peptide chain release factor N(5)-glutamine methyltransferase [Acidobacteriota bacterium]